MFSYTVKVRKSRDRTYLWGGAGLKTRLNSALFLTIRVDEMGEAINIGLLRAPTQSSSLEDIQIGTLGISETYTIQLTNISGVYAICTNNDADTKVDCFIEGSISNQ